MKKIINFIVLFLLVGSLFAQTGIVNNGARLVISNGAKLDIDGGTAAQYINNENGTVELEGVIELEGDWINNSSSTNVFTVYGENAEVSFDGSQTQTIGGTTGSNFPAVTIAGDFALSNDLVLPDNLTLNSGIIYLGDNNLILGENSDIVTVNTFSADNMIVTDGTGNLIKQISADGNYYFPIGDVDGNANFSPVTIDISATAYNSSNISLRVTNQKHPNNTNTQNYLKRYWEISQSGISGMNAIVDLKYESEDVFGNETFINTEMWNNSDWTSLEAAFAGTLSGTVSEFGSFTGFGNTVSVVDKISNENAVSVFANNDLLEISSKIDISKSDLYIFNILGQVVKLEKINNPTTNSVEINNLKTGYYLVRISGENIQYSRKVFVK